MYSYCVVKKFAAECPVSVPVTNSLPFTSTTETPDTGTADHTDVARSGSAVLLIIRLRNRQNNSLKIKRQAYYTFWCFSTLKNLLTKEVERM